MTETAEHLAGLFRSDRLTWRAAFLAAAAITEKDALIREQEAKP